MNVIISICASADLSVRSEYHVRYSMCVCVGGGGGVQYNVCGLHYWPLLYRINASYYCHTGEKVQILMLDECHLN